MSPPARRLLPSSVTVTRSRAPGPAASLWPRSTVGETPGLPLRALRLGPPPGTSDTRSGPRDVGVPTREMGLLNEWPIPLAGSACAGGGARTLQSAARVRPPDGPGSAPAVLCWSPSFGGSAVRGPRPFVSDAGTEPVWVHDRASLTGSVQAVFSFAHGQSQSGCHRALPPLGLRHGAP